MNHPKFARFSKKHDFPDWTGDSIDYIICSAPRCGSTLLASLLGATRQFGNPEEYLNHYVYLPWIRNRLGLGAAEAGTDIIPYLAALKRVRTSPNGVFGMKCHYSHIEPFLKDSAFHNWLKTTAFIQILRKDEIMQAISLVIAHQTKQWALTPRTHQNLNVEYKYAEISNAVERIRRENEGWTMLIQQLSARSTLIYYDDLVTDTNNTCQRVAQFITGVPSNTAFSLDMTPLVQQSTQLNTEWRNQYMHDVSRTR